MGLFGSKKSKEPEAPKAPEPVARAPERAQEPAPVARAPEPAPQPAFAPEPATAPRAEPAPQAAAPSFSEEPAAQENLSDEQVQHAIGESQQALMAVGHIMTFMMNAEDLKTATLAQARSIVWPAVTHQQFIVAMGQSTRTGHVTPVGVALWANVSDEIDQRLERETDKPFNLGPTDWNSGNNTWLIMLAGDGRAISPLVADMQNRQLNGRRVKMRVAQDGVVTVKDFEFTPQPVQ